MRAQPFGRPFRSLAGVVLALVALAPVSAGAVERVNQDREGVAVLGTDVVAYFTEGRAVRGSAEFEAEWQGARWQFASAEHRDAFRADPERHAPRYGGFCAYAVAHGGTAGIDPEAWEIVDGRLYLNLSPRIQRLWREDRDRFIAAADREWSVLAGER